MTISAFTITTNAIKNQYPIIESVKSILPLVDEVVIVDGGSTDGTIEQLRALGDKVRVIVDKDTIWEDDWTYWRMGKNWNRAFHECKGDWLIKFDADYVFDNNYNFRKECETADSYIINLDRLNFQLVDRCFRKTQKTLAVNMAKARRDNLNVEWGYDLKWGLCDEAVVYEKFENNLIQGSLLVKLDKFKEVSPIRIFNYGYCFRTEEVSKELFFRNMRAFYRQQGKGWPDIEKNWRCYISGCLSHMKNSVQTPVPLIYHPEEIRGRIERLTPEFGGYNLWGNFNKAEYYK